MLLSWGDSRPWSFPKGEQCLLRLCPEGGGGGGGDVSKQLSRRSPYKVVQGMTSVHYVYVLRGFKTIVQGASI